VKIIAWSSSAATAAAGRQAANRPPCRGNSAVLLPSSRDFDPAAGELGHWRMRWARAPLVRFMPNTPCWWGPALPAMLPSRGHARRSGPGRSPASTASAAPLSPEACSNGGHGLSGSGPVVFFVLIEALSDGGVRVGLPRGRRHAMVPRTFRRGQDAPEKRGCTGRSQDQGRQPGEPPMRRLHALETRGCRAASSTPWSSTTLDGMGKL